MEIVRSLTIDVGRANIFTPIDAKQTDKASRFLNVTLADHGQALQVPTTAVVLINAKRPDKASKAFAGVVNDDGTIKVPLSAWMLELEGTVICDISVISDNERLTTMSFQIAVERAAHIGSDISDSDQYDVLVDLISKVGNAQSVLEDAQEQVGELQSATTAANTAATKANSAAAKANSAAAAFDGGAFNITGAAVGQILVVKSVDANGKPTAWEAKSLTTIVSNGDEVAYG